MGLRSNYRHEVEHAAERIARLERSIDVAIETLPVKMRAVVEALQSLRGLRRSAPCRSWPSSELSRFARARQLMGYSGAVPWEDSSGPRVHRGSISKAGNAHLREQAACGDGRGSGTVALYLGDRCGDRAQPRHAASAARGLKKTTTRNHDASPTDTNGQRLGRHTAKGEPS